MIAGNMVFYIIGDNISEHFIFYEQIAAHALPIVILSEIANADL